MVANHDPQINWELGWKAIHKTLTSIKKERDVLEKSKVCPEDELFDLRVKICSNHDPNLILRMKVLEEEVKKREQLQTYLWHLYSRSTWGKIGDAPMAYFSMLVKAKSIWEMVKAIARVDGSITGDKLEVLNGVYDHCACLYKKDPRVATFHRNLDGSSELNYEEVLYCG